MRIAHWFGGTQKINANSQEVLFMKTIAIIDDELNLLNAYSLMLKNRGFRVLTAANAFTGVELILSEDVDLIITDINMPKKNGLTMIKQLRRIMKYRNVPIIILSAVGTKENVCRGVELGVCWFLSKPCKMDTLYNVVLESLDSSNSSNRLVSNTHINVVNNDISLLVYYENARVTDHFYEYLTEKFYKVYIESNVDNIENILAEKKIDMIVIEVDSPADESFSFLFKLCEQNKCIGIPIIVLSHDAREIRALFKSMKISIDKVLPKPFIYEKLISEIYMFMNKKNIKKKIDYSISKIKKDIKDNKNEKTQLIYELKQQVSKIRNENFQMLRKGSKSLLRNNHKKIDIISKDVARIKKEMILEKANLLEVERKAKLKKTALEEC